MRAAIFMLSLGLLLLVACSDEGKQGRSIAGSIQATAVTTPTPPPTPTSPPPTRTPTPTPPTRTPTPTPPPPPTPQAVAGPTFVVNTLPVGCHETPAASARIVVMRPPGTVQAMDQFIRQPDGTWHREVDQKCWTRTDPGPVVIFSTLTEAENVARAYRPTPPPPPPQAPPPAQTAGITFISVIGGPPGGRASVTVQAPPGASCSIVYVTPAGTVSRAQGLVPRTTDSTGRASWTWVIGTSTRPGTGTVTVSCSPGGTATTGIRIG